MRRKNLESYDDDMWDLGSQATSMDSIPSVGLQVPGRLKEIHCETILQKFSTVEYPDNIFDGAAQGP